MKARITEKSELNLANLTREYKFDIITDDSEIVLAEQLITSRPSEIVGTLQQKVAEYQAVYEDENDVQVDEII